MSLPPEDVLARAVGDPQLEVLPGVPLERALQPVADRLRVALHEITLTPLDEATPEYRAEVARLRAVLAVIARDAGTYVDTIDNAFRIAAKALGADQLATAEGTIQLEYPRGEWKVDAPALERELKNLVDAGVISEAELREVFTTTVETKANNQRLNYLAKHRGDAVREAIEAHRRYVEPSTFAGKVRYLEGQR
jgi:hypothetical protein